MKWEVLPVGRGQYANAWASGTSHRRSSTLKELARCITIDITYGSWFIIDDENDMIVLFNDDLMHDAIINGPLIINNMTNKWICCINVLQKRMLFSDTSVLHLIALKDLIHEWCIFQSSTVSSLEKKKRTKTSFNKIPSVSANNLLWPFSFLDIFSVFSLFHGLNHVNLQFLRVKFTAGVQNYLCRWINLEIQGS